MYEKEKLIKEERTREATRKGLMGLDGKFGCILRHLGHPIRSEGGSYFQSNEGIDFYSHEVEDDEQPVGMPLEGGDGDVDDAGWRGTSQEIAGVEKADIRDTSFQIGWHFDGLSRGMHLEIKYISDRSELAASWQGHTVYLEVAGELFQYVPGDWEKCINRLYVSAKKIEEKAARESTEIIKLEVQQEKWNFLDTLKRLWGV